MRLRAGVGASCTLVSRQLQSHIERAWANARFVILVGTVVETVYSLVVVALARGGARVAVPVHLGCTDSVTGVCVPACSRVVSCWALQPTNSAFSW